MASGDHYTGRNVVLVGGAALLGWWLLRGKRWTLGASGSDAVGAAAAMTLSEPCRLWIRSDGIELDGARIELASAVARCQDRGRAEVRATGDAITRSIMDVLRALQRAGVSIDASPDLLRLARVMEQR